MGIRGRLLSIALAAALPWPVFGFLFARENFTLFAVVGFVTGCLTVAAAVITARDIRTRPQLVDTAVVKIAEGDFTARLEETGENRRR